MTSDDVTRILNSSSNAQVGTLGEETTRWFLERQLDAIIITLGDAGMPRTANRQDLDITAVLEGELIAFEVKSRYLSRRAGKLTRGGDLLRPRLSRTSTGQRQGSQGYATERIADIVDTGDGCEGVNVRLAVVDFQLMMLQFFSLDDDGRVSTRLGPPMECATEAAVAYLEIVNHRGHL